MKLLTIFLAAVAASAVPAPDADGRYTLTAPGIRASFIPYGATLTNLFVKDRNGIERDVVLGYDNTSYYPVDPGHPVYNSIPGRYANRIGNATYTIDNTTYHTQVNDGPNTLHSGTNNWSYRTWNVTRVTNTSITFSILDPAFSSMGMPGDVRSSVTYSVSDSKWSITMDAAALTAKTPLMLTQHTYFQLDAFANPDNRTIWNHTLYIPSAKRNLPGDANALPTGVIANLGFASGNADFENHCGADCHGYNGPVVLDDNRNKSQVALTLSSDFSGIKADLRTNQDAIVLYTCNWNDGKTEFKSTQGYEGEPDKFIPRDGCIAIEAQDYVDGINHPEWARLSKQIFGPGQRYHWTASW